MTLTASDKSCGPPITFPADGFIDEEKLWDRLNSIYNGKVKQCSWVMGHWVVEGTDLTALNDVSSLGPVNATSFH
jgi:hypothetical protein